MSRARNVINIVNFVRQIDERTDIDLFQATVEEVRAVKAFGFPNTFLLQYDALIQPEYQRLLGALELSAMITISFSSPGRKCPVRSV